MNLRQLFLPACLGLCAMSGIVPGAAQAADTKPGADARADGAQPGVQALDEFRNGRNDRDPVRNRFFLKGKRFELAPSIGIVPNNPFARRFTVGAELGYHFNEQVAVQGVFAFAPDLGIRDVKSLTDVLLQRANDDDFGQPFDKVTLSAALGVTYAPFYGKLNLLGETVANFDFHIFAGLGFVTQTEYLAVKNPEFDPANPAEKNYSDITKGATEIHPSFIPGVGFNFFLTQSVALKLDARFHIYLDDKPTYDVDNPPEGLRAVPLFNASFGVAIFFPRMKPRMYDF